MGTLREDVQGLDLDLLETHISWVFLGDREAWKVKKPVSLGFLDFSTPAKRREACEAEVYLNRRLAPNVYRGIVPITKDRDGHHRLGGSGTALDWAVHMVRLPVGDRLDVRLAEGRVAAADIDHLAGYIADFHEKARCDTQTARYGTADAISVNVRENFLQTRGTIANHLSRAKADEIETWQLRFLEEHGAAFQERIRAGHVRDGHGDLRLEHVYLNDRAEPTIIDCIEFNERFRFADVCADVAFLSMDLASHDRVDLAERFLAAYARASNDYDLYPLVDFYESYRAYVRGKVASMLASDQNVTHRTRERAGEEARRYYLLALAAEQRSVLPAAVVVVGGLTASGKTTVADRLAAEMTAPVVDSDQTRKFLLGVPPTQPVHEPPWHGAYSPAFTEEVYTELLRRADAVLTSGRSVVLDASFRSRKWRRAALQLARDHRVPFHFVECRANLDVCRRRLQKRVSEPGVSDARTDLLDEFVARWEPVDELDEHQHIILDTSEPLETNVELLRQRLTTWPSGFAG